MDRKREETPLERLRESVGLPPGRHLDEEAAPALDRAAPRGSLTADDAEGLPPHNDVGTGMKREEG